MIFLISFHFFLGCALVGNFFQESLNIQECKKVNYTQQIVFDNLYGDTLTIEFLNNGNCWLKIAKFRNYRIKTDTVDCKVCNSVLNEEYLNYIYNIKSELNLDDCVVKKDTLFGSKPVIRYTEDFSSITNLQNQTIRIKIDTLIREIRYTEPITALKYCRENSERLKFIKVIDLLRGLR